MNSYSTISIVTVPELRDLAESVHILMTKEQERREHAGEEKTFKVRKNIILAEIEQFADHESMAEIKTSLRRTEVFFFFATPPGEPEIGKARLSAYLNALQGASTSGVHLVAPYLIGCRQDRRSKPRVSVTTKEIAKIIQSYGCVQSLFTFDVHAKQIELAYDIAFHDLSGQVLLAGHSREVPGWDATSVGIVSPDAGAATRADKFEAKTGYELKGFVHKKRKSPNKINRGRYVGDPIAGLHIILPDDLGDTLGTMAHAAEILLEEGALSVNAYLTHWLGSPYPVNNHPELLTAEAKVRKAKLRIVTTNSIYRSPQYLKDNADIITVVPCDPMLAKAMIASLTPAESVSDLSK